MGGGGEHEQKLTFLEAVSRPTGLENNDLSQGGT